jgi:hypothetical protein
MQPQRSGAPGLAVQVHTLTEAGEPGPPLLTEERADLPLLHGGRLRLAKSESAAHFYLRERPTDEDLLHPYLAPAAALYWQWSGHEAIHAGAFVVNGSAVLVLGEKEAGKSTTLGWLATVGGTIVLTDDLVVLDGASVLAGPRSIDLRTTEALTGVTTQAVRDGERQRVRLPAAPASLPLAGVVSLAWGPTVELCPVDFKDRLALLAANRTFPSLPANATGLLELGSVPMVQASRPRTLSSLAPFAQALVDYFS